MDQDERGRELFDSERSLQILIIGDTIPGLTLARFLQKHGFDPLVSTENTVRSPSELTTLWNKGVRLLSSVGIDRECFRGMLELEALLGLSSDIDFRLERINPDFDYPHPTVFSTAALRDALHAQVGDGRIRPKGVTTLSTRPDSIDVLFDDGVRESFDLVVSASTNPLESQFDSSHLSSPTTLYQHELPATIDRNRRTTVIEGWIDDVLVQQIPSPQSTESAVLRMTARKDTIPVNHVVTQWQQWTDAELFNQRDEPQRNEENIQKIQQQTGEFANGNTSSRWADGRRMFLSPRALKFAPASGFSVGFGIEDAWVLADEIYHANGDPVAIGNRFARRRRDRVATIRQRAIAVTSTHPYPVRGTEPFESVTALRTACLGSFCATDLTELQEQGRLGP